MTGDRRPMSLYERSLERFARTPAGTFFVKRVAPRIDPPLLRLSGGRFSSVFPAPAMLLTTTGAKTGLRRTLPLLYATDGESLIVIASNYGRPGHPAWYRNLVANPTVEVLAGKRSGTYTSVEITDPAERAAAWDKALDVYAGYADYEMKASHRTIPVIRLVRA
ncbi:nitroreductase/quinone reductase family protein [Mycolicibacterium sp. BiH015]|uniref:nitroreductase/quinone reductase family protein n=1 Tax=Mycolicibacterium sp. BiH015 TaxID=3018808 RepID=UPI0022DF6A26|nr:nitroreductase/quinone reductase family protein [Mycolicibacterium sp. BiH015]MDA2890053.1 nitroreductase/quinone reductase family protein [Mycolicibacterium sp. BiH015]